MSVIEFIYYYTEMIIHSRKSILYHLDIVDEKLDNLEELSEYPC